VKGGLADTLVRRPAPSEAQECGLYSLLKKVCFWVAQRFQRCVKAFAFSWGFSP